MCVMYNYNVTSQCKDISGFAALYVFKFVFLVVGALRMCGWVCADVTSEHSGSQYHRRNLFHPVACHYKALLQFQTLALNLVWLLNCFTKELIGFGK